LVDHRIDPDCELIVRGDNINMVENVSLSELSSKIGDLMFRLKENNPIDDPETLRVIYQFIGEAQ